MTIKKQCENLRNEVKTFETIEIQKAREALKRLRELRFGEEITDLLETISRTDYRSQPGFLANLFFSQKEFQQQVPPDERETTESIQIKYGLYLENLHKDTSERSQLKDATRYLEREVNIILAERNKRNVSRFSDYYNANELIERYRDKIRYCTLWKKWMIWDGTRWEKVENNAISYLAMKTVKSLFDKAAEMPPGEEALALMEHAGRSESIRKIEAMVRLAACEKRVWIRPEELDRERFYLNCRNGVIDLKCGRFKPHDPQLMMSKICTALYDEKAVCHNWLRFLKDIFKEDKQIIRFVQKVCGWTLTGDLSSQAMFILYGSGANGKSTFINTLMNLMGDYAANTPAETFMQRKGDQANNDVARLMGTRFVSAMETDAGGRLAESMIKRLTGNDQITARYLYGEFFDFYPTFKIFMATNHKPRITGVDNGIWRRIRLIPFTVSIPEEKQDRHLQERLIKEKSGILNWMIEGCILWQKEGLGEPPEIKEATSLYRSQMSAIETFLEDCTTREAMGMVRACELFKAYLAWCEDNHERAMGSRSFFMKMDDTGIDKVRQSKGMYYLEISLND